MSTSEDERVIETAQFHPSTTVQPLNVKISGWTPGLTEGGEPIDTAPVPSSRRRDLISPPYTPAQEQLDGRHFHVKQVSNCSSTVEVTDHTQAEAKAADEDISLPEALDELAVTVRIRQQGRLTIDSEDTHSQYRLDTLKQRHPDELTGSMHMIVASLAVGTEPVTPDIDRHDLQLLKWLKDTPMYGPLLDLAADLYDQQDRDGAAPTAEESWVTADVASHIRDQMADDDTEPTTNDSEDDQQ